MISHYEISLPNAEKLTKLVPAVAAITSVVARVIPKVMVMVSLPGNGVA